MKSPKQSVSPESQAEAMKIAKSTQKPAQTKEQTKLIAQGIEKGIALYKKQQKEKNRQIDRARKKSQKAKVVENQTVKKNEQESALDTGSNSSNNTKLPWILLLISWVGFIAFWFLQSRP